MTTGFRLGLARYSLSLMCGGRLAVTSDLFHLPTGGVNQELTT